nr:prepilin-type N-terminal cleavage/methylation domain-containing protein [Natranaerobius trueperi]
MSKVNNTRGFTLIETLGVIILIAIIISILYPNVVKTIDIFVLDGAHNKLYQDLRLVKMQALKTEQLSRISFPYFGPQNYYVLHLPNRTKINYLPDGINFSTLNTGGSDFYNPEVVFAPDGVPWGGATIGISNKQGDTKYVVIAAVSGRIRKSEVLPGF